MENLNNKKILIIRLSALGDTIHTLPMANALKKEYPNAILDWVVEDKASKFIINNPLINNVYELPKKKWKQNKNKVENLKEFFEIIKKIRKEKYDIVLDTQQLLKSGIILGLSKGKRKITLNDGREFSGVFANEIIKTGRKQFDLYYHVVKRNMEFAKYLGCKDLDIEFKLPNFENEYSKEIKEKVSRLDKTKKTIVIAPATTWRNKHWNIKSWVEIINTFKDSCNIIITAGSNKEKELAERILSFITGGNILNLSGQTSLSDLVYIYQNCDLLISPDSGSAHIAWATGKCKIFTVFFATSSARTAPFGDNYYAYSSNSKCSPCMKKFCKLKANKYNCIYNLNSEKLINNIKKVLQIN